MNLRNRKLYLSTIFFVTLQILILSSSEAFAQNTNPIVENVAFTIDGTTVTITYDLKDAEQTTVNIRIFVSEDDGSTWTEKTSEVSGDIGDLNNITNTASQQSITWTYNGNSQDILKIRIIANDKTADGSPCPDTPTVTYAGKTYHTIQIVDQCWLKENLDVGGWLVSGSNHSGQQQKDNGVIEKYCYKNDTNNCNIYGGLYEWDEAMNYVSEEGSQGICPDGWHIPTFAEFKTLETYANQKATKLIDENAHSGFSYTNETGFSALFEGTRSSDDGSFYDLDYASYLWSSSGSSTPYYVLLTYINPGASFEHYGKTYGFSVRCLKD